MANHVYNGCNENVFVILSALFKKYMFYSKCKDTEVSYTLCVLLSVPAKWKLGDISCVVGL